MPEAVTRDGVHVHYASRGRGAAVVLLHPANASSRAWTDLGWAERLDASGHRAVSLDSRGFGASDPTSDPDRLAPGTSSLDIAAVLDALEIEAAHLCGFSLGAAHALRFAFDLPGRARSLVLGGLAMGPLVQTGLYLGGDAEAARREALAQLERPLIRSSGAARRYFEAVRTSISRAAPSPVAPAQLPPVLGVAGDDDPFDPASLYRALRAGGARVEIEIVPDTGHGACFVHPEFRRRAISFVVRMEEERGGDRSIPDR